MVRPVVDIHWDPDPMVFSEAILAVDEALDHVEIPLAFSAAEVQADVRERFETETEPDGTPWRQWSPSYATYALAFPNIGILTQTGELKEAATADEAYVVSGDTLFFEGDLPHGGWAHQFGAVRGVDPVTGRPNILPARPFLGLSDQTRAVIFATFGEWFDRAIDIYTTVTGRLGRRHAIRGVSGQFVPRSVPMPVRIRRR